MKNLLPEIKKIPISDFDYPLPDDRIARHPLAQRDACLLLRRDTAGNLSHHTFADVADLLPDGSVLVCNDTRVINARVKFQKATGAEVEVFLLEPMRPHDYVLMFQARGECSWSCLVGNLKRWKLGSLEKELLIGGRKVVLSAERGEALPGNAHEITFRWSDESLSFASVIEAAGYIPIPPYLRRASEESDSEDYQTIYAENEGSVAAPTAGLHFTPSLFARLEGHGVSIVPVTLHVGAGTFQPVKSDVIGQHPMHTEVFSVTREALLTLTDALRTGRPVTAVGTTSVRTVESLPYLGFQLLDGDDSLKVGQWDAYEFEGSESGSVEQTIGALEAIISYMDERKLCSLTASTAIMIAPGFDWRIVSRVITNFHQPQSTLLLLVSSFLGDAPGDVSAGGRWRPVYDEALKGAYRFLSYGDACLFERK
ncbi:MAG: S-adenosylmethionine:tRNA ribosyltransferase-isomerase [Muribaculaceae bacterium]|nr:S-adenosylmethionine:tRNA ribosyltransferase-isomerase [Muribaculaceae bacterium]